MMTAFISAFHFSLVGGNAANVFRTGIAHLGQQSHRLTAPGSAAAVDKKRSVFSGGDLIRCTQGLQGNVDAAGDVSLLIFLGRADIQQDRAAGFVVFIDALVDIRAAQKIENTHIFLPLVFDSASIPESGVRFRDKITFFARETGALPSDDKRFHHPRLLS